MDHHADTLEMLAGYLTSQGHTVTTARNQAEALARWAQAPCDLLISELRLPDGDGCDLLAQLHSAQPFYALAVTSLGLAADRARSQAAGFRHHLLKPFKLADFDAAVQEAARELAAHDQPAEQTRAA